MTSVNVSVVYFSEFVDFPERSQIEVKAVFGQRQYVEPVRSFCFADNSAIRFSTLFELPIKFLQHFYVPEFLCFICGDVSFRFVIRHVMSVLRYLLGPLGVLNVVFGFAHFKSAHA